MSSRQARRSSRSRSANIRSRLSHIEGLEAREMLSNLPVARPMYQVAALVSNTSPPRGAYTPAQIQQAYQFNKVSFNGVAGDGTGQTIAIVDAYDDPNIQADLNAFDSQFGLPDATVTRVDQGGGTSYPSTDSSGGWELEESLDVEWAHAMAPRASIMLVEANSPNDSDLLAAVGYAAQQANVVSMSWGGGEFSGEASHDSDFSRPGVAFVASSGDSGAPISWPAASPDVLAVGGTSLSTSGGSYAGETGWSGSGGGPSAYEPMPSYQSGVVTATTMRANPDVAYDADPNTGYAVYDSFAYGGSSYGWIRLGGTSAGAPQWAAILAIADQGRALAGQAAVDASSAQEVMAALYRSPGDFHDVTSGTSTGSPSYSAGPGYDYVTGLGSPMVNLVINSLDGNATPPTTATATFVKQDATTQGSWSGTYGSQGYEVIGGTTSLPSYATITPSGQSTWTYTSSTTDPRAPQTAAGSSTRAAAVWYSPSSFSVDVNLADGQAHGLELYLLDYDRLGRSETVQISDAASGAVLSTQSVASFGSGVYLDYQVSGHVEITISNGAGSPNAVLSGLFLDSTTPAASASATFVKQDAATQGSWSGTYGGQGYEVIGGTTSLPSYATITPSGQSSWTYTSSTTDPRAPQTAAGSSTRAAAVWYSPSSFSVDVNLADGQAHNLELYLLDYDRLGRSETVQISDAASGAVLSTQSASSFGSGVYLDYQVSGHIKVTIINAAGSQNAVLSGLFLG